MELLPINIVVPAGDRNYIFSAFTVTNCRLSTTGRQIVFTVFADKSEITFLKLKYGDNQSWVL